MRRIYSLLLAGSIVFAVSCQSGQKKAGEKSAKDTTAVAPAAPELNKLSSEEASAGMDIVVRRNHFKRLERVQ